MVEYEDEEILPKKDNSQLLDGMSILFAEFLGTLLLVFISCMGCTQGMSDGNISLLQLNLTAGLAVMTVIQIFAHISGAHVNPAVTLCALLNGVIPFKIVPIYIGAQIAGSLSGYALVIALTPDQHLNVPEGHCVTLPSREITLFQGFLTETVATFVLCLAVCSSWDFRNSKSTDSLALRVGLVVAVLNMAMSPFTGASMNPMRSFGPAVWNQNYYAHWIYWLGPLTGGFFAGFFYNKIFWKLH